MFGEVLKFDIQYDNRSGRSMGNAWVIYKDRAPAEEALKTYQGVALDGQPMKIELEDTVQRLSTLTSGRKYAGGGWGGGFGVRVHLASECGVVYSLGKATVQLVLVYVSWKICNKEAHDASHRDRHSPVAGVAHSSVRS